MKQPSIRIVQWWPKDKPLPVGWKMADQRSTHHSAWSVLIEQVDMSKNPPFLDIT